jgi:hypothetical protein
MCSCSGTGFVGSRLTDGAERCFLGLPYRTGTVPYWYRTAPYWYRTVLVPYRAVPVPCRTVPVLVPCRYWYRAGIVTVPVLEPYRALPVPCRTVPYRAVPVPCPLSRVRSRACRTGFIASFIPLEKSGQLELREHAALCGKSDVPVLS